MQFSHYLFVLFGLITVTFLEISAIRSHKWIVYKTPSSSPLHLTSQYGLFERCDKASLSFLQTHSLASDAGSWSFVSVGNETEILTSRSDLLPFKNREIRDVKHDKRGEEDVHHGWRCHRFPTKDDCSGNDFCAFWRSSGYLSLLSLIFLVSAIISTVFVLSLGGRLRRANGWRIVSGTSSVSAVLQITSMSLIASLFNNDERFYFGSKLSTGFFLQILSWLLSLLGTATLIGVGHHAEKAELDGGPGGDGYRRLE